MRLPMDRDELRRRIGDLPRVALGHLPTPLERLERFSGALGGPEVLMKRDDCTGLAFGGNKTRHNEFILGQALKRGADTLVWGAGVQSNNCRQTAAACARLGLRCHLVLTTANHSNDVQGNLLLDYLLGATVEFTDAPLGDPLWQRLSETAQRLAAEGHRVFTITDPLSRAAAAVSYVLAALELAEQLDQRRWSAEAVYVSSAGATAAGLFLAGKLVGLPWCVHSITPIHWPFDTAQYVADIANGACELLGLPPCLTADDTLVRPEFVGSAYGQPTAAGMEATRLLAQTEGILLDPVYTAKAMAGLIADVRAGKWKAGQRVVFIHTGGTPALFAYHRELAAEFA